MISGFYMPNQGSIKLNSELAGKSAYQIARSGIARTYQTSQLFDDMSVLENLLAAMQQGELGSPLVSKKSGNEAFALNLLFFR